VAGASRAFLEGKARALRLLAARPTLVVSDFDGTLSPIVPDPLAARIDPLARTALRRLSRIARQRPDRLRLFILSGRAVVDVAGRVRVGGLEYLGNHGLEAGRLGRRARPESIRVELDPALEAFVGPARELGLRVAEALGRPAWLFVEGKGPSVAFHFRRAADPVGAMRAIEDALVAVELEPGVATGKGVGRFERFDGRRVIEFRPSGVGGKALAMERLVARERPGSVLILGDDRSDAEAFRVARAGRAEGRFESLAVGVHGASETPVDVVAAADVIVESPHDAARLLSAIGRDLEREA
jgi:trehalose 6-phosphate phosphatase